MMTGMRHISQLRIIIIIVVVIIIIIIVIIVLFELYCFLFIIIISIIINNTFNVFISGCLLHQHKSILFSKECNFTAGH